MGPLGVWIAHLRGPAVPSLVNTFVIFLPNYACGRGRDAAVHVFHRMGRSCGRPGSWAATNWSSSSAPAAWAKCGARGTGCSRARPRSSWFARAARRKYRGEAAAACCAASSAKRRRPRTLSSPHTIRLFDFGVTEDGTFYYVMELLDGRDLESLVREFGPVPPSARCSCCDRSVHSLAEAHARGLIHRDIKPANIYACRMGLDYDFVKVLDFGLVKFQDRRVRGSDANAC